MSAYRPRRMKLCPAWLVLVALIMPSCTRVEIEDHSLQFNQAAGSLGNRVMLLNIVRAAKGYPLQFSKLTGYTGHGHAYAVSSGKLDRARFRVSAFSW
jgi:hypothetical protein